MHIQSIGSVWPTSRNICAVTRRCTVEAPRMFLAKLARLYSKSGQKVQFFDLRNVFCYNLMVFEALCINCLIFGMPKIGRFGMIRK